MSGQLSTAIACCTTGSPVCASSRPAMPPVCITCSLTAVGVRSGPLLCQSVAVAGCCATAECPSAPAATALLDTGMGSSSSICGSPDGMLMALGGASSTCSETSTLFDVWPQDVLPACGCDCTVSDMFTCRAAHLVRQGGQRLLQQLSNGWHPPPQRLIHRSFPPRATLPEP